MSGCPVRNKLTVFFGAIMVKLKVNHLRGFYE